MTANVPTSLTIQQHVAQSGARTSIYPHVRLLLAAITFSGALGALLILVGFVAAFWLTSQPPEDPPDNAPIRAVAFLIYVVAPFLAILSLALSVPASYMQWPRTPFHFAWIALACTLVALGTVAAFLLPDSSLSSTATVGAVFAAVIILAAFCWRIAMPRHGPTLEQMLDE